MIEHVARAMRRNRFVRTGVVGAFDKDTPLTANELDDARACLEALREPSEAMLIEGYGETPCDWMVGSPEQLKAVWQSMIDVALLEDR